MGCDVHVHIEIKKNNKWWHWSAPQVDRNYKLFSLMAGVRNYDEIEPISEPKGLPEDITFPTKIDAERWGIDKHDCSWLGIEEIIEFRERYKIYTDSGGVFILFEIFKTWIGGNSLTGWYEYPEENDLGIEDLRIVFWFDN